ncbi:MAG: tRNA dihydrouridine synthase DusB [Candidatus Zapsychrus exili]|nr:tRNA dihydrouridine synthase DusB [Candidatus Zapsychrus exili]
MKIGNISIDKPIILAPMDDITDLPFRLIRKELGSDIGITEFTGCEALIRDVPKAFKNVELSDKERPVGIQLFGSVPESMELAIKKIEYLKPDFIDINCGCVSRKHVNRSEGAGLLKDLPLLQQIVKKSVGATKIPVTVKTRLGWDDDNISILDVAKIVEQAGVKALSVHLRTKAQVYKGKANWGWIEKIKKATSLPFIGNGDIKTPEDAKLMFELGCDGIMIGRAAVSNPWIFKEIKHYIKTGKTLPIEPLRGRIDICIKHLKMTIDYHGQDRGILMFRKYYSGYLKGVPHISQLRSDLMQLVDFDRIIERLNSFLNKESKNYD